MDLIEFMFNIRGVFCLEPMARYGLGLRWTKMDLAWRMSEDIAKKIPLTNAWHGYLRQSCLLFFLKKSAILFDHDKKCIDR